LVREWKYSCKNHHFQAEKSTRLRSNNGFNIN
jgi:hypothetical protein